MSAKFKYLLFNFHENQFQVKQAQENRLFNFRSIVNIEEVIDDFSQINENLFKVPTLQFVMMPNSKDFDPSKASSATLSQICDNFEKFKQNLMDFFTNKRMSKINQKESKLQFQNIKVVRDFEQKSDIKSRNPLFESDFTIQRNETSKEIFEKILNPPKSCHHAKREFRR